MGIELGCTDKSASNFNPQANKDDGSCKLPVNNKSGGSLGLLLDVIAIANPLCSTEELDKLMTFP